MNNPSIKVPREYFRLLFKRYKFRLERRWHYVINRSCHKQPNPFFILSTPRTGSNLLVSYLNCFQNLECLAEVFNPNTFIGLSREASKSRSLAYLRYAIYGSIQPQCGAKLFFQHLNERNIQFEDLDREFPAARYLVLFRKSLVDQYISHKLAKLSGNWSRKVHKQKITLNPKEYLAYSAKTKRAYDFVWQNPNLLSRSLILSYEDLVADPEKVFIHRIARFLDAEPAHLKTTLVKQNQQSLEEVLENYNEIKDAINYNNSWDPYKEILKVSSDSNSHL